MTFPGPATEIVDAADLERALRDLCAIGPRFVGTDGERAAAAYIEAAFVAAGLANVRTEPVPVLAYRPGRVSCHVVGTSSDLPCTGLQFTAAASVEADAVYLGAVDSPDDLVASGAELLLEGMIAVLRTAYPYAVVPALVARGVAGVVVLGETPDGLLGHFTAQLYPPSEPPAFPGAPLTVPGVTIEASVGEQLIRRIVRGRVSLRLEHEATYERIVTANVLGEIPGTGPDVVVMGAHYDTQLGTEGACDNASGVSAVIAFARQHARLKPVRTIVLAAFADEEHGCYGSLAYCRRHADDMDRTVAMINLDALGWAPRAKRALWADPSIRDFCAFSAGEIGWVAEDELEASAFAGSDYNPFIDAGVPAAFFWRYPPGNPYYHSAGDVLDALDLSVVHETARVAAHVTLALAQTVDLDLGRARPSHTWLDLRGGNLKCQ